MNFLGITFDSKLSWALHKEDVRQVALIEVLAHEKNFQTSGQNCEIIFISCKSHFKMLKIIKFGGFRR
jgi:hypothetical protein